MRLRRQTTGRLWVEPWVVVASIVLAGCGKQEQVIPNRAIVVGTVTIDGQPIQGGSISFTSEADPAVRITTSLRTGGRYRTDRAPIGKCQVSIETESVLSGNAAAYVKIPAKYNEPSTSGLTAEIQAGDNADVNFNLEN